MAFQIDYPLGQVRPATYNPRRIDEATFDELRESLRELGFVKPIVVTKSGLIVAGHQRTRAAKVIGMTSAPAFVLDEVGEADEIRFNQLHNGCEIDVSGELILVPPGAQDGWAEVHPSRIVGPTKSGGNAAERQEMLRLLTKYGAFSGCVASETGEVISGQQYATCCWILRIPLLVRRVPASLSTAVKARLSRSYGEYSYDHLPRTTWAQSLAQMSRLQGEGQLKSSLYEKVAIPTLTKTQRILDFGCGKGAYVDKLRSEGFDIQGIEFFRRKGHAIDVHGVQRDITRLLSNVASKGLFDVVICDSVLNSVDRIESEQDVLATAHAFTKPGGILMFSGRSRDEQESRARMSQLRAPNRRYVEFLDENGFSAIYRSGVWHYQRFHRLEEVHAIGRTYIGDGYAITGGDRASKVTAKLVAGSWQVCGTKTAALPPEQAESAIGREFDLPIPGGSYGRSDEAISAIRAGSSKY